MPGIELLGFWAAKGPVRYQDFKRQLLPGQVLSDLKDNASMEPVQKKGFQCPGLLVEQ